MPVKDLIHRIVAACRASRLRKNYLPFARLRSATPGLLIGLLSVSCGADEDTAAAAAIAAPPAQVTVVTLSEGPVTVTRQLPGRTTPYMVAEVRPQATGIVKERMFEEGGLVKAGQALYQLDDSTYRADVAVANAQLARAEATAHSAALTARRTVELATTNAVSRQEKDNADATLRQAEADIAAARAALERAQVMLGYTRITSPIDGHIGKSTVTQGALVNANQDEALATVQQLDPIYIDISISSSELLAVRKEFATGKLQRRTDRPVTIVLEDGTPYDYPGTFAFTESVVDPDTGSVSLRVVAPNPEHILLPGLFVRAVFNAAVRERAVLVPQKAIIRDLKGNTTAMVLNAENMIEQRAVTVSRTVGDQWLVEDGLSDGDRVIVEGLQKIRPGMPAEGTEAAAGS